MRLKRIPMFGLVVAVLGFAGWLTAGARNPGSGPDKKSEQAKPYARPTDASLYVGSETCKMCHEDVYKHFESSPHFLTTLDSKLAKADGPEWHGCEACHGPGKAHVDGGGDKSKIFTFKDSTAVETSARCLDCHAANQQQSNYGRSAHLRSNVGCIDCHSPHAAKESQFILKKKSPELCYSCHADIKAQFVKPFHHRVNEGLVKCDDCHNPHGTYQQKQLRVTASQDEVCYKCHAEKQGPWVYQHEAKLEGCVACHTPHGSSNPRLLKINQVNLLCMECHAFPSGTGPAATPSFHNQAQKYQACTVCHTAIHGSNTSAVFFTP